MKTLGTEYFRDNEKIAVTHSIWKPCLKKHNHLFFEIAFITNGSGYHVLNNVKHPIQKGALFLIAPGSEHTLVAKETPFEWINILFFPSIITASLIDIADTSDIFKALMTAKTIHYSTDGLNDIELQKNTQELQYIFEEMLSEFENRKTGYEHILKGYLEILLVKIFREYFYTPNTDTKILQNILEQLQKKSLRNKIDMDELAKKAFFSPQYFRKLFKEESGVPLATFIRQKRLEYAKYLLETTDMTVKEIMWEVGFNDTKSFYTAFKRLYKTTPAACRK